MRAKSRKRGRREIDRAAAKKRERNRLWRASAAGKAQNREWMRRHCFRCKLACLAHYSGRKKPRCACCGERNIGFLTLDFVHDDGSEHQQAFGGNVAIYLFRKGFPKKPAIQVLCYNCNCGRDVNSGVCPHDRPLTLDTFHRASRNRGSPKRK